MTILRWAAFAVMNMQLALFAPLAYSQAVSGTLVGTVTDSSEAALPGATITALEVATGIVTTGSTNTVGTYSIPYLRPGTYRITIQANGFASVVRENVPLTAASSLRVDAMLRPGDVSDRVDVTAEAPLLQTDRSDVSRNIGQRAVTELPTSDRNFQSLVGTLPGVTPPQSAHAEDEQPWNSLTYRVNGQAGSANNTQVDGVDDNDPLVGITIYVPAAEAIQEVNIATNNYNAEFGRAGGAVVNVITRGGTNELHGSLFEFHRDTALTARNLFNVEPQAKPSTIRNQFGGTIGGPIRTDKLFFFGSYQGTYQRRGLQEVTTVPVDAWRKGDFSAVPGLAIFDPMTGTQDGKGRLQFANNQIPANRISPVAAKILPLLVQPNTSGLDVNLNYNNPFSNDGNALDGRLDYRLNDRTNAFLKYAYSRYEVGQGSPLGNVIGEARTSRARTHTVAFNVNRTFTPTLLAEGRIGYNRYFVSILGTNQDSMNEQLGIANPTPDYISQHGMPRIEIAGMAGIGELVYYPLVNANNLFNFVNTWTKMAGRHSVKWGADIRRLRLDRLQPQGLDLGPRGLFNFQPGTTSLDGGPDLGSYGEFANSFASFLLGAPDQTSRTYLTVTPTDRQTDWFAFVHDTYQVMPKLTVDLGLRWELYSPVHPRYPAGASNYDPGTNSLLVAGVGDVDMNMGVKADTNNFAPRVGFSYRASNRWVVRGGYGISYFTGRYGFNGALLSTQFPVIYNVQNGVMGDYRVDGSLNTLPAVPLRSVPNSGRITPAPDEAYFMLPSELATPYVQSFNLTQQWDLGNNWSLEAGYVGSLGRKQPYRIELNVAPPGTGSAGMLLYSMFGRTSSTQMYANGVSNSYHSLQTNLVKRFSSGLQFNAAYTYGKSLGYNDDQGRFQNNIDISANYGPASYDRTHMLNLTHIYELPFGPGKDYLKSGLLSHIIGSWQLNGVFRAVTGTPVNITASASPCNCPGNRNYADALYPTTILGGRGPGALWFDKSAFAAPGRNRFGNVGRNSVRGPGYGAYDFSVFRTFAVRESVKFEFRAEAFNLTNTPIWDNPNGNFNSGTFGQIRSAGGQRQFQFAARMRF
jgi:hypothetical protein